MRRRQEGTDLVGAEEADTEEVTTIRRHHMIINRQGVVSRLGLMANNSSKAGGQGSGAERWQVQRLGTWLAIGLIRRGSSLGTRTMAQVRGVVVVETTGTMGRAVRAQVRRRRGMRALGLDPQAVDDTLLGTIRRLTLEISFAYRMMKIQENHA